MACYCGNCASHQSYTVYGAGSEEPVAMESVLLRPEVLNTREKDYGDVRVNHERIARLWSAYLGFEVTAHQVAVCMSLVKISRLRNTPNHEDSYEDIDGYMHIARQLA